MSENQLTINSHIIPKRYVKNFVNSDEKIFYASKNNGRIVKESDKKFLFAAGTNIYNHYSGIYNVSDEFEEFLGKKEDQISKSVKNLIKNIETGIENGVFDFKYNDKITIIRAITLLYEKIIYHRIQKEFLEDGYDVIRKEYLVIPFKFLNALLPSFYGILLILTLDEFNRSILYSSKDLFYFGDTPFHIDSKGKHKQWMSFFNNHGSSLYFPLTKNLAIYISYPKINEKREILYNLDENNNKNKFLSDIHERIIVNSVNYISGPNDKYLKYLIKNKKKFNKFSRDINNDHGYAVILREARGIKNFIEDLKQKNNLDDLNIALNNISDEAKMQYKLINDKFSQPDGLKSILGIITGWESDIIQQTLKSKRYIDFFRNSKSNLESIDKYFKIN